MPPIRVGEVLLAGGVAFEPAHDRAFALALAGAAVDVRLVGRWQRGRGAMQGSAALAWRLPPPVGAGTPGSADARPRPRLGLHRPPLPSTARRARDPPPTRRLPRPRQPGLHREAGSGNPKNGSCGRTSTRPSTTPGKGSAAISTATPPRAQRAVGRPTRCAKPWRIPRTTKTGGLNCQLRKCSALSFGLCGRDRLAGGERALFIVFN